MEHESEHERGEQENLNEFERLSQTTNGEFVAEGEEVVLIRRKQVLSGFDDIITIIRNNYDAGEDSDGCDEDKSANHVSRQREDQVG